MQSEQLTFVAAAGPTTTEAGYVPCDPSEIAPGDSTIIVNNRCVVVGQPSQLHRQLNSTPTTEAHSAETFHQVPRPTSTIPETTASTTSSTTSIAESTTSSLVEVVPQPTSVVLAHHNEGSSFPSVELGVVGVLAIGLAALGERKRRSHRQSK